MRQQIAQELADKLRSGEYEQGTGYLRAQVIMGGLPQEKEVWCCAGVLANMAVNAGIAIWEKDDTADEEARLRGVSPWRLRDVLPPDHDCSDCPPHGLGDGDHASTQVLTPLVMQWAGVKDSELAPEACHDYNDDAEALTAMNDSYISFEGIAEVLLDSPDSY